MDYVRLYTPSKNWNKHIDKSIRVCTTDGANGSSDQCWSTWTTSLSQVKIKFCADYEMTNLGECKKYLNVRITRTKESLTMDQTKYAEFIMNKYSV